MGTNIEATTKLQRKTPKRAKKVKANRQSLGGNNTRRMKREARKPKDKSSKENPHNRKFHKPKKVWTTFDSYIEYLG